MKKFNSRKKGFLDEFVKKSPGVYEAVCEKLSFSFQYFDDSQPAAQSFSAWDHDEIVKLLEKLRNYSRENKEYWRRMPIGGHGSTVLVLYGGFPENSELRHPRFVPEDVCWARFRLESGVRLCGFFIPRERCKELEISQSVFYVVFLDKDHKFYRTEER